LGNMVGHFASESKQAVPRFDKSLFTR